MLLQPLACRPFLLGRACSLGTQVTGALGMQVRHQCPRCVPGLLCPATMLFPPLPPLPNAPCQVYQGVEEAEVLCGVYRVSKLPCILAIDPATGALMRQWAGFLPPDRCVRGGPGRLAAARCSKGLPDRVSLLGLRST